MESSLHFRLGQRSSFDVVSEGIELCIVIVCMDTTLACVQSDCTLWPRRATHWLIKPGLFAVRSLFRGWRPGGLDVSHLGLIVGLVILKFLLRGLL